MKTSRLISDIDYIWSIFSMHNIGYLQPMNRLYNCGATPMSIKRIEYENKRNNNIY